MKKNTLYTPQKSEQVKKLCMLGAMDKEIWDFFGICQSTLMRWKKENPEFTQAMRDGKSVADAEVSAKLFHRATGYSHPEVHISNYRGEITKTDIIKHYPPDPVACIFWLKNRRPDLWRDRVEHTGNNGKDLVPEADVMEVARNIGFVLMSAMEKNDAAKEVTIQ